MATTTTMLTAERATAHWSFPTRVAFRFCFFYFVLNSARDLLNHSVRPYVPYPSALWPARQVISWTAAHVFGINTPLVYANTGSGDKIFDWVSTFCLLVLAALVSITWSILGRRRQEYVALHKWFRLFIRFTLAGAMVSYGTAKTFLAQMQFPTLWLLLKPFGTFSPRGILWASVGAAPGYEIFTGCAELLGGILLFNPRTTTLGALICLADTVQVFALNMTYDVPVKLYTFHLLLMAVLLLAPDAPRLANLFFLNRAATPSTQPELFRTSRANRAILAAQVLFGAWMVMGVSGPAAWNTSRTPERGGGARSPLYGIWDVEQFSIDGQLRPPLLDDKQRWRRAIFELPNVASVQQMDDSFVCCGASIDVDTKTIVLTKPDERNWKANFAFERPSPDRLTLDGQMDGHRVQVRLKLFERNKFVLVNRGFHWVQDRPSNL